MADRTRPATLAEVADYLQVPKQTIYGWNIKGIGPRYAKIGRHCRYTWADIDAWLAERADRDTP